MRRCYNERQLSFKYYGARGIKVARRWWTFENFLADMGAQPVGTSIDRIDYTRGYEPGNCRWATRKQQARNKSNNNRITFGGDTLCIVEWAERLGIKQRTLRARLYDYGWSVRRAFTTPVMSYAESSALARAKRYGNEI